MTQGRDPASFATLYIVSLWHLQRAGSRNPEDTGSVVTESLWERLKEGRVYLGWGLEGTVCYWQGRCGMLGLPFLL